MAVVIREWSLLGTAARFRRIRNRLPRESCPAALGFAIHDSELLIFRISQFENVLFETVKLRLIFGGDGFDQLGERRILIAAQAAHE